jgi:alpha-L-rhamnosidase
MIFTTYNSGHLMAFLVVSGILISMPAFTQGPLWKESPLEGTLVSRFIVAPTEVKWKSHAVPYINNEQHLLEPPIGQAVLGSNASYFSMKSDGKSNPSVLLDFGRELHGAIQLVSGQPKDKRPVRVRVVLGESVSEAMSEITEENGATNDHAMRDFELEIPWLGWIETGNSGFRFARIELLDRDRALVLKEINAVLVVQDVPWLGSFHSDDELLNQIWDVGAYTVFLNMQDYVWDGIKRDRLVWIGDLHPEVASIHAVFGHNEAVPRSLDLLKKQTPLPGWMNGISSYSLWWVILHRDMYIQHGDLEYLKEQEDYLAELTRQIASNIENGIERLDGWRFLDWPSNGDSLATHAGLQALSLRALISAREMFEALGNQEMTKFTNNVIREMQDYSHQEIASKQAAALLSLVGLMDQQKAADIIQKDGVHRFSTFYGYYMLQALAGAGRYTEAMESIKTYWGAMLQLGATTFWEDFNIQWMENAAPIDNFVPEGKIDVHATYGNFSYKKLRHSLCHGWASGPTAWMSQHVLGVQPAKPGSLTLRISPNLGHLTKVEGSYPLPDGRKLIISHEKSDSGEIHSLIQVPKGFKIEVDKSRVRKYKIRKI